MHRRNQVHLTRLPIAPINPTITAKPGVLQLDVVVSDAINILVISLSTGLEVGLKRLYETPLVVLPDALHRLAV